MRRHWQPISLEEARQHPLYGVKNWLAVFAFGVLLLPLRELGALNSSAHDAGMSLAQWLAIDAGFGTYIKIVLGLEASMAAIIFWLLFTKQRSFRLVASSLLLGYWPTMALVLLLVPGAKVAIAGLAFNLMPWAISTAVWVTYLQRSRRVRITFENCVIVSATTSIHSQNQMQPADKHWAMALTEIEEGRLDKGVWARSFAESGGDEGKAKALYIKARAESIKDAAVWADTRPPSAQGAGVKVTDERQAPPLVTNSFATSPIEIVVWVVFVLAIFGWWQYREHAKRQEVAAAPVQAPAPQFADLKPFNAKLDDYEDGVATNKRGDYAGAVAIFRPLAENGHADAQYSLGLMHRAGRGVPTDNVEAAKWYRLAANQGHAGAQAQLGMMYGQGEGVVQNYREAAILARMAAEQGDRIGQSQLGVAYLMGHGVPENIVLAHMWFNLSAVNGDSRNRDTIAKNMSPQQIAQAQQLANDCKQQNFKGCN